MNANLEALDARLQNTKACLETLKSNQSNNNASQAYLQNKYAVDANNAKPTEMITSTNNVSETMK